MNDLETKKSIKASLASFATKPLGEAAIALFEALGYSSQKRIILKPNTPDTFVATFAKEKALNPDKALLADWKSVDFLFQLTDDEVRAAGGGNQQFLFESKAKWNGAAIESYLFFAIRLKDSHYSRTDLSEITRAVNRLFPMPAMLLFRHGDTLTLAIINRRLHKRDESKDVLEKVTLIKDIRISDPHRAHIEILFDLSFDSLREKHTFTNFVTLHTSWQKALDSSELNKRFFQEIANWYFWSLKHVAFPKDAPKQDGKDHISVIRLITRLMFVWFLKEKGLVPDTLFEDQKLAQILKGFAPDKTTDKESVYYKGILQNLFFATLNTEMDKRGWTKEEQNFMAHSLYRFRDSFQKPDDALDLFKNVPFLNGGLFECLDKDLGEHAKPRYMRIDGFSRREDSQAVVPDFLFFGPETIINLSTDYGDDKYKKVVVRGLVHTLNHYKFTVAENTPIEEEIALDPELSGKVFENLLAAYNPETGATARKQTGSFYTPREIVNYMVDEALISCLKTKFDSTLPPANDAEVRLRHLVAYNHESHHFSAPEVDVLIKAIDFLKSIDPAVGSGAFPMGILHKLVFILGKLDPRNEKWKMRQISRVRDAMATAEKIEDSIVREKALLELDQQITGINDAFEHNELDYGRKLYLIENCIYGVDIQSIAVQIAKMRFFISLIVDQKIDETQPNRGVRPLPNLETKFVAANTLIGVNRPGQQLLRNRNIDIKEAELRRVRERHFLARTPKQKTKCRADDAELRTAIAELLKGDGWDTATSRKLASWNPYDQNASADFFDPEWMFGLTEGFDIAIGNPPYVLLQNSQIEASQRQYLIAKYTTAQYKVDLYHLFIEAGVKFLGAGGVLAYITPNTFLKNKHNNKLRELLVNQTKIENVVLFYRRVFEDPSVDNLVITCQRCEKPNEVVSNTIMVREIRDGNLVEQLQAGRPFPQADIKAPDYSFQLDITSDTSAILTKIENGSTQFGKIGGSYFGIQTFDRDTFVGQEKRNRFFKPVIDGGNVFRFFTTPSVEYVDFQRENVKSGGDPGIYARQRIVVRQIGRYPEGAICPDGILTLNTIYNLFLNDASFDLRYILALINSRVIHFYWLQRFYDNKETFPKIKKQPLHSIPIKKCTTEVLRKITEYVDKIVAAKQIDTTADTSALESDIDQCVYAVYGLSPEDVKIVEDSCK
jgi:type I restriction-modification system DNA methylase subunit